MKSKKAKLHEYSIFLTSGGKTKDNKIKEFLIENWEGNLLDSLKKCARLKKEGGGCSTQKTLNGVLEKIKSLESPPYQLLDNIDWTIYNEKYLLGTSITSHSTDLVDSQYVCDTSCKDFLNGKAGLMNFVVQIKTCREHEIKKGQNEGKKMAFLSIEDSSCAMSDVCVFAETYQEFGSLLYEGAIVLIQGEKDKKKGSLIVKKVISV